MPATRDDSVSDASGALSSQDWTNLLKLAHTNKGRAFQAYAMHYLSTHGQIYWSDTMQLSTYLPNYDQVVKEVCRRDVDQSLVIGEICVPPDQLAQFLFRARRVLHETAAEDIYGTIRSILHDNVTFLAWARRDYACVIFNLRTLHDSAGIGRTAEAFRRLQAAAIQLDGSFYLTYHRFATREQIDACYPQFSHFLRLKDLYDPNERFTSDWYRHMRTLFA